VFLDDEAAVAVHTVGDYQVVVFVFVLLHNSQVGPFALLHNRTMVYPATPLRRSSLVGLDTSGECGAPLLETPRTTPSISKTDVEFRAHAAARTSSGTPGAAL